MHLFQLLNQHRHRNKKITELLRERPFSSEGWFFIKNILMPNFMEKNLESQVVTKKC